MNYHQLITITLIAFTLFAGCIIPYILFRRYSKLDAFKVIVGSGLLIITLMIQPAIQAIPLMAISEKLRESLAFIAYAAGVSGFLQEGLKLAAVGRYRGSPLATLWIGYGFGIAETVLVAFNQVIAFYAGIPLSVFLLMMASYERFITTMFHVSTTVLLAYSFKSNVIFTYAVLSLIHAGMNFGAGYVSIISQKGVFLSLLLLLYLIITVIVIPMVVISIRVCRQWLKAGMS